MPEKKEKEFVSFADAHDDWVRKSRPGFLARLRHSRLLPPPDSSAIETALGCLWRVVLLATAVTVVVGFVATLRLSGNAFGQTIAAELRDLLEAEDVQVPALKWKNRVAAISFLEARGSDTSFFHRLSAQGIRFHLPWSMTFADEWRLESIWMQGFDIDLDEDLPAPPEPEAGAAPASERGAGAAPAGESPAAGEKEKQLAPDETVPPARPTEPAFTEFGIHPRLDQLHFEVLTAQEGAFRWGRSPASAGRLEKGAVALTRAGSTFSLNFTSGSLSQNWLTGLRIAGLAVRIEPGAILIEEGELRLGKAGTGTLRGKITTGAMPQIAAEVDLTSVSIEDILPRKYTEHATGVVDLSLKFTGSTATPAGVVCHGTMRVTEALVRNIPAFESMTTIYAEPLFRRLKVTGGTLSFTTHEGLIEITDLDLACGDFARLRADFRMIDPEKQDFSGTLDFGVRADTLQRYPQIADAHFPRGEGEFRWATTRLEGTVSQLTQELSASLAATMRSINLEKKRRAP